MTPLTYNELPTAVQTIIEQMQTLIQKIDNLPLATPTVQDENRYVDIVEIQQLVFRQWKKQTIYNKCYLGQVPHSRIGGRLVFHLKECQEWRDSQIQHGKIKALSQIENEAQAFFDSKN